MKPIYCIQIAVLLFSCSQEPIFQSDISTVVVESFLNPALPVQTVTLREATNVAASDGLNVSNLDQPLSGAMVLVRSHEQEILFQEVAPGIYQDTGEKLNVLPETTYSLEVLDGKGRTMTAQTTVPAQISFIRPGNTTEFTTASDVLFEWSKGNVTRYAFGEVIPECWRVNSELEVPFHLLEITQKTDISLRFQQWQGCNDANRSVMKLRILAPDSIGLSYLWPRRSVRQETADGSIRFTVFNGQKPSNIRNGVGIFASMVTDSVTIFVEPADTGGEF